MKEIMYVKHVFMTKDRRLILVNHRPYHETAVPIAGSSLSGALRIWVSVDEQFNPADIYTTSGKTPPHRVLRQRTKYGVAFSVEAKRIADEAGYVIQDPPRRINGTTYAYTDPPYVNPENIDPVPVEMIVRIND